MKTVAEGVAVDRMDRFGLAAALVAMLAAGPASAQGRPDATAMTCGQARQLVLARGAVVLGTGGQTYDRFVSSRRFCEVTEVTRNAFVPTRDTPQCFVGYRCIEPSYNDWWSDF